MSEVSGNFSAVFLGSLVIPVFVGKLEVPKVPVVLFGAALTIASLFLAIKFGEKGKV